MPGPRLPLSFRPLHAQKPPSRTGRPASAPGAGAHRRPPGADGLCELPPPPSSCSVRCRLRPPESLPAQMPAGQPTQVSSGTVFPLTLRGGVRKVIDSSELMSRRDPGTQARGGRHRAEAARLPRRARLHSDSALATAHSPLPTSWAPGLSWRTVDQTVGSGRPPTTHGHPGPRPSTLPYPLAQMRCQPAGVWPGRTR